MDMLGRTSGSHGSGAWSALEAQKAKYHVLAQLQPLAVSLASGDPIQGQRAALVVASLVSDQSTREATLTHPVCEIVLLRLCQLLQADLKDVAAAAAKAIRALSGDPEARRRLLYPRQSSLLGPRSPEEVVRSMIAGLVVLTQSPDEESVADAVISLRNMMCDSGVWDRLKQQSDTMFKELLCGLVRAMRLQGINRHFMLAATAAAEALSAICGHAELRERILLPGVLETLLQLLSELMDAGYEGDTAAVICSLLGGEETRGYQTAHLATAVLTRHPNALSLLQSLIRQMKHSAEPHALINAHRSLALILGNEDLASCLGRIDEAAANQLIHVLSKMMRETDPKVTIEAVVAMNRVILACGTLLFSPSNYNREVFENLVHGWTGLLTSEDHDGCVAAAQCIHSFVECDEGQAIVVMWPNMEEMVTLVGRLVSHLACRPGQETVLHAKTAAALASLFRCTPGETLLRRLLQPEEDVSIGPMPPQTGFWNLTQWFSITCHEVKEDGTSPSTSDAPPRAEVLQIFLARLGVAVCMDSLDVAGPASEILCCWAAVEPAWDLLLSQPVVSQILSGFVKMVGRPLPPALSRNAVIGIHSFTVEEKGRVYLRSLNLQTIRAMLGGLLLHSQRAHDSRTANKTGTLTAQIANGALKNLRDSGEECWPRWINGLSLPNEVDMRERA